MSGDVNMHRSFCDNWGRGISCSRASISPSWLCWNKTCISAEAKRGRVSLEESWQSSGIHHALWSHQKLSTCINTFLRAPERGLLSVQGTSRGIDREGSQPCVCGPNAPSSWLPSLPVHSRPLNLAPDTKHRDRVLSL